jgi:8-oxo-dGTP pyrophosphatase MutT (NUDIX family)
MSDWKTLKSEIVYETAWIKVRRDEVLNHKGKPLTYSVIDLQHPSVFIVATNDKHEIFIQQEYKYTIDRTIWAIPAGHADGEASEDLLKAAKRELLEEAGLVSDDWTDLGLFFQGIGIANLPYRIFLARDVRSESDARDEVEQISNQHFVPIEKIEKMIASGDFFDAPAIAAVYSAKIHGI